MDVPVKIRLRYLAIVLVRKRQVVKGVMREVIYDHLVDFSGKVQERHLGVGIAVERRLFGDGGRNFDRVVPLKSTCRCVECMENMCLCKCKS